VKKILMLVFVLGMAGAFLSAQSAKPMDLYQEGLYLQEVKGDLRKAIEVYQSIVTRYASDRALVSKALFQLATCYEKLGQPEANAVYQRIMKEYPDAVNVTAAARTRLSLLPPVPAQGNPLAVRRVLTTDPPPTTTDLDISPSGGQFVTGRGMDLVIHDTVTGQQTVLVPGAASGRAVAPVFSRDGRQVVYAWRSPEGSHLGAIGIESGAKPRRFATLQGDLANAIPIGWANDGRSVLVTTLSAAQPRTIGLAWVSVSDGTVRFARSLGRVRPRGRTLRLSPDGQFVAYSSVSGSAEEPPTGENLPHRLFLASVSGTSETEVVTMAGSHYDPVWSPDGSHLLFVSNRGGSLALWSVRIQGGSAVGVASQVLAGHSNFMLGISQHGTLFSTDFKGDGNVTFIAERGVGGRILTSFPGGGGDWSPDGQSFAFKPRNGLGTEVIVRSMDTGAERSFKRENIASASPHWLGNSGFIINVQGEPQGSGGSLHFVDIASRAFRRLYSARFDDLDRWSFSTPDDGSKIFQLLKKAGPGQPIVGVVAVDPATGANGPVAMFPEPLQSQGVPAFDVSADGQSLAVAWRSVGEQTVRMFTIRTDGSGYRPLGEPFLAGNLPDTVRWTPDGSAILYVAVENPGPTARSRVMRIPAAGGTPTFEGIEVAGPIWNIDPSPDGSRIAYSTNAPAVIELWAIDNIMALLSGR
jgi:Tol biopolymer transport system component